MMIKKGISMTDIALSSLSRNTLLSLSQKKPPPVTSANASIATAAPADRFTLSSEAVDRLNAEKTNAQASPQGFGKLTLTDLNGEGANLVSLQTRQQLGTQSLSLANQQQQTLLRLFA